MTKRRPRRARSVAADSGGAATSVESPGVVSGIWTYLSLAGAVVVASATFSALRPMLQKLPVWDQWSMIEVFEAHAAGRSVLPLLLKPYNGHLNVLPRALFFLVGLCSDWDVRLEVLLSYVAVAATLAIVLRMLADTRRELLWLAMPVAAQVVCLTQFENYLSGYPLGQLLSQLAATACVFLVTRHDVSPRRILAAAGCAVVATFSWGAGFVAWPLLCVLLFLRLGLGRPVLLSAATTLLMAWIVRHGAGPRVIDWPAVGGFFIATLGTATPPHAFPDFVEARGTGAAAIAVVLLLVGICWRRGERLALLRWGGYAALAVASALLIAIGRAGPGFETQALASHYATATYSLAVATTALAGLLLLGRTTATPSPIRIVLIAVLGLAIGAHSLCNSWSVYRAVASWQPYADAVNRHLIDGTATDEEIHRATYPDAALVRGGLAFLKQHRLAGFAVEPASSH